jgi:hypothetical protein
MPNQPKTPIRTFRVADDLWDEVKALAAANDTTVSEVVRDALTLYVSTYWRDPLPDHSCQHVAYRMTCEQYDALRARRGGGECEICGTVPRKLWIDHDHTLGFGAVRGLLCQRCNAHLRRVDAGERVADEATASYLANPWHQRGDSPPT